MSLNTILATAPNTTTNYVLKATGTSIGNSLIFDNGTNVGIGTTNPLQRLHVYNSASSSAAIFQGSSNSYIQLGVTNESYIGNVSGALLLETGGSERMRITTGGQLGLGNTVSAWDSNWKALQMGSYGATVVGRANDNSYFITKNVYFNGTDWVGVTTGWAQQMFFDNSGNTIWRNVNATANTVTGFNESMRITSGGNVLIGKTSVVGFPLEVNGGVYASSFRINDTGGGYVTLEMQDSTRWRINYLGRFSGYGAGTLTTDASGNITASSDRKLKDVIKPVENVLNKVMEFEPVYFKWNDKTDLDKENVYISTIAQSIEKDFPEAVGKMADGTLTVQDRAVLAIAIAAIKELSTELTELKALIAAK